jgi:hypothetical protein
MGLGENVIGWNDHLLVGKRSLRAYREAYDFGVIPDSYELDDKRSDLDRKRIGFYFLILEKMSGISDVEVISKMIIDTHYRSAVLKEGTHIDDMGVDAYYIDKDNHVIKLFNFKYRGKDVKNSPNDKIKKSGFKGNDAYASFKFLQVLLNGLDPEGIASFLGTESGGVFNALQEINEYRYAEEDFSIELYFVSDDEMPLTPEEQKKIEIIYGISVIPVSLKEISDILIRVKRDVSAKLRIPEEKIMPYSETKLSSNSYVFTISLFDLVRITCKDKDVRMDVSPDLSDKKCLEIINDISLESAVLHDNVRGDLGKTSYNKGIVNSIFTEPHKFFMYNNGITITAKDVDYRHNPGTPDGFLYLEHFQVVNGGQTLRSIYTFIEDNIKDNPDGVISSLRGASVLVRAYNVGFGEDGDFIEEGEVYSVGARIAQYTNSQNAIRPADLHSNDLIQIKLSKFLSENGYEYILKRGEIAKNKKSGGKIVSMELVAQIIMAVSNNSPEKISNEKRKLFTDFYDQIFNDSTKFDAIKNLLDKYFLVMDYYTQKGERKSVQRDLYTLYIMKNINLSKVEDSVNISESDIDICSQILSEAFKSFKPGENLAKNRRLAYGKFKDAVDEQIKIYITKK